MLSAPAFVGAQPKKVTFEEHVRPLLKEYCYRCHGEDEQNADLDLSGFTKASDVTDSSELWETVFKQIKEEEMPAEDPKPSAEERKLLVDWIAKELKLEEEE